MEVILELHISYFEKGSIQLLQGYIHNQLTDCHPLILCCNSISCLWFSITVRLRSQTCNPFFKCRNYLQNISRARLGNYLDRVASGNARIGDSAGILKKKPAWKKSVAKYSHTVARKTIETYP